MDNNKNNFNPKNLYVGRFCWFPQEFDFLQVDDMNFTKQRYIFDKINETEYNEAFSNISTIEWPELSCERRVPYIVDIEPIFKYVPEFKLKGNVDKIELLIALDIINFSCEKEKEKTRKLSFDSLLVPKK